MASRDPREAADVQVECIVPILRVTSLPESLRFYTEALGFQLDWGDSQGSDMASVSRCGHAIMLCQGAQGHLGTWIWIGVEDIDPCLSNINARVSSSFKHRSNGRGPMRCRSRTPTVTFFDSVPSRRTPGTREHAGHSHPAGRVGLRPNPRVQAPATLASKRSVEAIHARHAGVRS